MGIISHLCSAMGLSQELLCHLSHEASLISVSPPKFLASAVRCPTPTTPAKTRFAVLYSGNLPVFPPTHLLYLSWVINSLI